MEQLVKRLAGLTWDQVKPETAEAAKLTLIDSLGTLIFGNQEAENARYAALVFAHEKGRYSVIGTPYRLSMKEAAFINGCGSVATEMDEGNQWSKGHPAAHVVPVLLAGVQAMDTCSGERFLLAFITGYEACSRFGRAATLLPTAHAHGTWGVMGAAASALLLEQANEELIIQGVMLGASFALPTMWTAALEGALVRNAYVGHAIEMGVGVPALLKAGFRAPRSIVEYVYGQVLGSNFNYQALHGVAEDGVWDVERNYFKPYGFCRYAHAPIDAFGELVDRHSLKMEEIERVEVSTYSRAATLNNTSPHNVLSAKFSIPYALAVRLATGSADQDSFTESLLNSEPVCSLAERVSVRFIEQLEENYPNDMPAVVRIELRDGSMLENRCDMAVGGPGRPLGRVDVEAKFRQLTGHVLTKEKQEAILAYIWSLEKQRDVSKLIELCTLSV